MFDGAQGVEGQIENSANIVIASRATTLAQPMITCHNIRTSLKARFEDGTLTCSVLCFPANAFQLSRRLTRVALRKFACRQFIAGAGRQQRTLGFVWSE